MLVTEVAKSVLSAKILITGSGRAGTTFLVQLLTALGLDTGFGAKTDGSYFPKARAGLEKDVFDPDAPKVIKSPFLCDQIDEVVARQIEIEHVVVPIRAFHEAAESRRKVQGATTGQRDGNAVAGGLWGTTRADEQPVLEHKFATLMESLTRHDIPTTLVSFPRLVKDADYLYGKLVALIPGISIGEFRQAHAAVARPELVSNFDLPLPVVNEVGFEPNWGGPIDEELVALPGSSILATKSIIAEGVVGIGSAFRDSAAEYDERYYNDDGQRAVFRKALAITGRTSEMIVGPVLDLGCGSGNSTFAILNEVPNATILASDLSPEMLEILMKRALEREVATRITPFVANAEHLQLRRESCDIIVGSSMIHHMMAPRDFLSKSLRALKPNGIAYFIEPFQAGHFAIRQSMAALVEIAQVKKDLDAKYVQFLRQYLVTIDTMMKEEGRDPEFYIQLEDKWMFPRGFFETTAKAEGCDVTIFSVSPSNQGTYEAIMDLLYKGTGDKVEMPAWATELLTSNDAVLTPNLREELLHVGCIVFHKRP